MRIVILGLSITSSWGNGHATTYRSLIRELAARGHSVLFLERDVPWYAENRDLKRASYCRIALYSTMADLRKRFTSAVRKADVVIVGSYTPEGVALGEWVVNTAQGITAFYDIDTPVTLAKLRARDFEYVTPALIARYHLYLSFTGGPTLDVLERKYHSPCARPLYCSVDPAAYFPEPAAVEWDLGYMGTYSVDRQPTLERLLMESASRLLARRFAVVGPQYPDDIAWPENVARIDHLAPSAHRKFYNAQRFTLNVTREQMIKSGYSPSVRLFEAAACGTPIISDAWRGLEEVLEPGREILVAKSSADVVEYLVDMPDAERLALAQRARAAVLARHTAAHRAAELEEHLQALIGGGLPEGAAIVA